MWRYILKQYIRWLWLTARFWRRKTGIRLCQNMRHRSEIGVVLALDRAHSIFVSILHWQRRRIIVILIQSSWGLRESWLEVLRLRILLLQLLLLLLKLLDFQILLKRKLWLVYFLCWFKWLRYRSFRYLIKYYTNILISIKELVILKLFPIRHYLKNFLN